MIVVVLLNNLELVDVVFEEGEQNDEKEMPLLSKREILRAGGITGAVLLHEQLHHEIALKNCEEFNKHKIQNLTSIKCCFFKDHVTKVY